VRHLPPTIWFVLYSPPSPQLIAHRGDTRAAPDNSAAAVRAAAALGVDMVEFDVCASADGAPVVIHGPRLERWSSGTGRVAHAPLEHLVGLTLRGRDGEGLVDESLPTLGDILDVAGTMPVNCDIKDPVVVDVVVAELVARDMAHRAVLSGLTGRQARRTLRRHGLQVAVLVNPSRLDVVVGRWHRVRTGWLLRRYRRLFRDAIIGINVPHGWIDERLVAGVHRLGGTVWAFTVDDQDRVDELVAMGVDSITTNRPGEIAIRRAGDLTGP